ncbi:RNA polymerase sigma-70 factor (sigma-E family) [Nocardioides ginsengisegetis]|uniref:RNA polymerase sigma-70 factor (Sigma-E family) n=1 Tax=Nocardioides ginsengisegetis TaxID=661491 RepID=A0A7W3J370_9ACTN|nr:SigE family RNA polymerase sigma factor [Nocardioides ginsengisegetis]MBA8805471.1 RNA polymerase sigma-70 factor (sigma-E family) [Nocardioides ginsengisegetis]
MRSKRRDAEFSAWAADVQAQLLRKAYLLSGDQESARDLVQQVLLSTYLAWTRVDHPTAYARTSMLRAFFKMAKVSQRELPAETIPERIEQSHPTDERLTLLNVLAALPPRMRATVMLRFWDDLSVADTAAVLGCSEGTVKSATSRALAQLRRCLGEDFDVDLPLTTALGGTR